MSGLQEKTLICLYGLPRSGKSTIASKLRKKLGAPVVNADAIRLSLHGQLYQPLAEYFVKAIKLIMIRSLFEAGHETVICDETNFSRAVRDTLKSKKWKTVFLEVNTPPEECKTRAIATNQLYLLPVIDSMVARREPLCEDEECYIFSEE